MSESITKELRSVNAVTLTEMLISGKWDGYRAVLMSTTLRGSIADGIDERFTHELDAKQAEIDALKSDNTELQARLDASIPLPLDADGVPCKWGDMVWHDDANGPVKAWRKDTRGRWYVCVTGNDHERTWLTSECRHVAPEPETIEDVRKSKDDLVAFLAQSGVMGWKDLNSFAVDFSAVLERAYECGMRDSCARGGYADPSVLGGDAS